MSPRTRTWGWATPVALAVIVIAATVTPALDLLDSAATLVSSANVTGNIATAGSCTPGPYTWTAALQDTTVIPEASRVLWTRLDGTTSMSDSTWTPAAISAVWTPVDAASIGYATSGALYCDPNTSMTTGDAGDYVESATATQADFGLTATAPTTVMVWVRPTSNDSVLVSLNDGRTSSRTLWIDANGRARFSAIDYSGTSWSTSTTGPSLLDGSWHLVVATMTGYATASGGAIVSVDGREVSTGEATNPFPDLGTSGDVRWRIGATDGTVVPDGVPADAVRGAIDELVVTASSLSTAQQTTLFKSADR